MISAEGSIKFTLRFLFFIHAQVFLIFKRRQNTLNKVLTSTVGLVFIPRRHRYSLHIVLAACPSRINIFVTDVVLNSWDCTGKTSIKDPYIKMSDEFSKTMTLLRNFMFENFYLPVSDSKQGKIATKIINLLFSYYDENFSAIPDKYSQYDIEKEEKISNFICGMTDLYAINIAEKISPGISDKLRFENI